jgi:hypothetical protein
LSAVRVAVAGLIALAAAMGIGRFAFTPILPMMLHDGVVDLHAASWLASANYIGYLIGALGCTLQPRLWARVPRLPLIDAPLLVRTGLVGTALLTLAMAVPVAALWPTLRFAAGIASALVFVYSSGWCLAQLAARGRPELGGAMFAGPGAGIVASGLLASAMVASRMTSTVAWLVFGALAAVLTAMVWRVFAPSSSIDRRPAPAAATRPPAHADAAPATAPHGFAEVATLAFAYGISGFGYIVTATFLPVIARASLPPASPWLDLFWPIFGVGVIVGALLATRVRIGGDLRLVLAAAYVLQAVAIAIGVGAPTATGFAVGSVLLGLPFTAITYFALQEVRRLRPLQIAGTTGLVTVVWSVGQAAGPSMVALLLRRGGAVDAAFTLALEIAAAALVFGGLVFLASSRLWPKASLR